MKQENTPKYHIEAYHPKYEDQVIDLIDRSLKEMKVIEDRKEKIDDEDLRRINEVYSGKGRFWVALEENKVIGTVAIRDMSEGTAKLNRMFVMSDYHGKGIGQELLNHAMQHARNQEFSEVILNTHINMQRAHRFYEKNGFVQVGQGEDKYHYRIMLN